MLSGLRITFVYNMGLNADRALGGSNNCRARRSRRRVEYDILTPSATWRRGARTAAWVSFPRPSNARMRPAHADRVREAPALQQRRAQGEFPSPYLRVRAHAVERLVRVAVGRWSSASPSSRFRDISACRRLALPCHQPHEHYPQGSPPDVARQPAAAPRAGRRPFRDHPPSDSPRRSGPSSARPSSRSRSPTRPPVQPGFPDRSRPLHAVGRRSDDVSSPWSSSSRATSSSSWWNAAADCRSHVPGEVGPRPVGSDHRALRPRAHRRQRVDSRQHREDRQPADGGVCGGHEVAQDYYRDREATVARPRYEDRAGDTQAAVEASRNVVAVRGQSKARSRKGGSGWSRCLGRGRAPTGKTWRRSSPSNRRASRLDECAPRPIVPGCLRGWRRD